MAGGSSSYSSSSQPFPLSRLLFTFVQRIAAPISTRIRVRAEASRAFKEYLVLPPARTYHFYEAKIKYPVIMLFKNKNTSPGVKGMSEKAELDLGSRLLAEGILILLASGFALRESLTGKKESPEDDYIKYLRDIRERLEEIKLHSGEISRLSDDLQSMAKLTNS
ncbi:Optic atrophy 3 protein -like protein [Caligus rogercresseyi]|uniref:Optic atrophy 3 protein -like protein n=1 Tax=Caligus rogercresseyi TaxID=217165 RepID=A0A7T8JXK1_CALRO|nr:Optic atrophy 3 protein -like protein [Caligus rogercresseyi]|eukprot:TRINITY_DN16821_c0_g1_i1.p1 TRINITY_DN16821_c0_g1~~TRINITY_DN16821_c0_g1_i1.p1  ORF type:complete len:165 (+),score=43.19 TRINITY_DN16821_c0_g1_i1:28-522(+)